jgi:hypothetical protein
MSLAERTTPMNSSIGGPDPNHFAARLGTLAADVHSAPPRTDTSRSMPISPRLAEVLASLRRQREAFETFKANHFIMAD